MGRRSILASISMNVGLPTAPWGACQTDAFPPRYTIRVDRRYDSRPQKMRGYGKLATGPRIVRAHLIMGFCRNYDCLNLTPDCVGPKGSLIPPDFCHGAETDGLSNKNIPFVEKRGNSKS